MNQNIQVIDNDGLLVDCFKTANSTIQNWTFINRRIKKLRDFFNMDVMNYLKLDKSFIYDLYFYKSYSNNAFATKHKEGYVIAFSTALFLNLYNRFNLLFSQPDVRKLFNIDDNTEANFFVLACFDYSTYFIALHELCHIINGHCSTSLLLKIIKSKGLLNELNTDSSNPLINFYGQVKECFADISATAILATYVYKHADYAFVNNSKYYNLPKEI